MFGLLKVNCAKKLVVQPGRKSKSALAYFAYSTLHKMIKKLFLFYEKGHLNLTSSYI